MHTILRTLALAGAGLAAACGGDATVGLSLGFGSGTGGTAGLTLVYGSSSPGRSGNPAPARSDLLVLLVREGEPPRGDLQLADPDNPASLRTLAPAGSYQQARAVTAGALDPATGVPVGLHERVALYTRDNRFYLVSLLKAESAAPVRVSSEAAADTACNLRVETDYADFARSAVVYELPGADGSCTASADNPVRLVRLGMGETQAPRQARRPVAALRDGAGAIVGWLAVDGQTLRRVDADFNPVATVLSPVASVSLLGQDVTGRSLALLVDGAIRNFDSGTHTLGPSRHRPPGGVAQVAADCTQLFYVAAGDATRIYRLPFADSGLPQVWVQDALARVEAILVAGQRLVYLRNDGLDRGVRSVPRGGQAIPVPTPLASGALSNVEVSRSRVFYRRLGADGVEWAGTVAETGGGAFELAGARWLGRTRAAAADPVSCSLPAHALVRAEGMAGGTLAGARLQGVEPGSGAAIAALGALPAGVEGFAVDGRGALGLGLATGGSARDWFLLDPARGSSLARLTTGIR